MNRNGRVISKLFLIFCTASILIYSQALYSNSYKFLTGRDNEPNSKLVLEKNELTKKDRIITKITEDNKVYTEEELQKLDKEINTLKNSIDRNILKLKDQVSKIVEYKKSFMEYSDIDKIDSQIKEKEESKKSIKSEVRKNLENINFKGLYIVAYKYKNAFADKKDLTKKVQNFLTPIAVQDLRGTFINSYTVVKNYKTVMDKISATTKGQMKIEENYVNVANAKDRVFVYMAKVNVSPLEHEITTNSSISGNNKENCLIINPLVDDKFEQKLLDFGVKPKIIENEVLKTVRNKKRIIIRENSAQVKNEKKQIARGVEQIDNINREIKKLKKSIKDKNKILKNLYATIKYNPGGYSKKKIAKAIAVLDERIKKLNNKLYEVKEKELIEDETFLIAQGNPKEEIAKKIIFLIDRMGKTYQKVDKFFSKEEVENYMLVNEEHKREINIYREIDKVWVYIVPADNDGWQVKIVSKFKLTETSKKVAVIPQSSNPLSTDPSYYWFLLGFPVILIPIYIRKKRNKKPVSSFRTKQTTNKTPNYQTPITTPSKPVYSSTANKTPKNFVLVKAASFEMGEDEDKHHVTLTNDFYMSKYQLTFAEYDQFCTATGKEKPDDEDWGRENRPVINVSWYDAVEYCNWLSSKEGLAKCYSGSGKNIRCDFSKKGYRLPTEAEWEFAARGGSLSNRTRSGVEGYEYSGSNDVADVAWYDENSGDKTHPVGKKRPNELGLHDMSGNVWEWCWDWHDYSFDQAGNYNPTGVESGSRRVLRGGSWLSDAENCRTASRDDDLPVGSSFCGGFRVVRPL